MRYHELIDRYKNNQLDEIQKQQVETDIEKQEAISEYLFDREDSGIFGNLSAESDSMKSQVGSDFQQFTSASEFGQSQAGSELTRRAAGADAAHLSAGSGLSHPRIRTDRKGKMDAGDFGVSEKTELAFIRMVNRRIKCTFIKLGVCVTMVTLAAVLFVIFLLPNIVDHFYYDPGESIGKHGNRISLDYCVYTELCMPGYNRDNVSVQGRGYGVYDILILQNMSYNKLFTNLTGKVERGKLTLYDPNVLQRPVGNAFAWFQMEGDRTDSLSDLIEKEKKVNYCLAGSKQEAAKALQDLGEQEAYVAYVSLDRMMPYEEFMQFLAGLDQEKQIGNVWCAVCTKDPTENRFSNMEHFGFQCELSVSHALDWDRETYPHLVLWNDDAQDAVSDAGLEENIQSEAFMKTHFTSMLRYMADQEAFLNMQEPLGVQNAQEYRNAADYVEENGLMIYGFAGIGNKKALLGLNQEKEVYEIYTQKLR